MCAESSHARKERSIDGEFFVTTQRVTLLHGEGGRVMRSFLREVVAARLAGCGVQLDNDAADLGQIPDSLAMTTDSFVVTPLFFPGGDIGKLAVYGTVNDLAVSGATPLYLALSMIVEEGFELAVLNRVLDSVANAARRCGVQVATGDTKVLPAGSVDGLLLNTSGVGCFREPRIPGPARLKPKVDLLVSGPIGMHGLAVLCERESLGFDPPPNSDCGPLIDIARVLREALGSDLVAMRDATRGGVASVLHEWAETSGQAMWIDESRLPIAPDCRGICEMLGMDPLFIANEGTLVAAVAGNRSGDAIAALRRVCGCDEAQVIGEVRERKSSPVIVRRVIGTDHPLDEPHAAMLPRIC